MAYQMEIESRLSELQASGIVLTPYVIEEKPLPVNDKFIGRAFLMPEMVQKKLRVTEFAAADKCFFCCCEDEVLSEGEGYKLIANNFPYVKDQVMVVPVSHRELPSEDDFMSALTFQRESKLIGILNLRGSGGSLPDHLHFEFGRANLPVLQLPSKQDAIDYYGAPLTALPDYPGSVLVLQDSNVEELASNTYSLTRDLYDFGLSFNLIIDHDRALIIPREAVESRALPGWSAGGLFLSGIFVPDCRSSTAQDTQALFEFLKERFYFMNADRYRSVIEGVTLSETGAREFINRLHLPFGSDWINSVSERMFMRQQHPV